MLIKMCLKFNKIIIILASFLIFVHAKNSAENNFEVFGELFGNFTIKIDENQPVISELRNDLEDLHEGQNVTISQLNELKQVIERQNELIAEQESKIQNQTKLLDNFEVLLQSLQGTIDKAKKKGQWVSVCKSVPPGAIQGGHGYDTGEVHYVGRALHNNNWIAAKVLAKGEAYVAYEKKEYYKECYDVLVGGRYKWVHSSHGAPVLNAVSTQFNLYVGRVQHKKTLTVGKVARGDGIYVPYGKKAHKYDTYEVLVEDPVFD